MKYSLIFSVRFTISAIDSLVRVLTASVNFICFLFIVQVVAFSVLSYNISPVYGASYQFEKIFPVVNQQWFFGTPSSVAEDRYGNIYVLNESSNNVYKYTAEGQFIKGWGKKGTKNGEFNNPYSIAVSPDSFIYISDTYNHRIQIFSLDGEFIQSLGKYGIGSDSFSYPCEIAFDNKGNFFVVEAGNNRVQKFSSKREFITSFGTLGDDPGQFHSPYGIAIDSKNNVYVSDLYNSRIQVFTEDGVWINGWNISYPGMTYKSYPTGMCVDSNDNLYVSDSTNQNIVKFSKDGQYLLDWGGQGNENGKFSLAIPGIGYDYYLGAVVYDSKGHIIVADTYNNRLQTFTQNGDFLMSWSSGGTANDQLHYPFGLTLDNQNNIYIVDCGNDRVKIYSSQGILQSSFGKTGSLNGEFNAPHGIDIDSSGNIYVVDTYNHRIQVFSSQGVFIRTFGTKGGHHGAFDTPFGIAINSRDDIYIADSGNNRIQKLSKTGAFISIVGESESVQLNYPIDIEIDQNDNLLVLDTYNSRVLKFSATGKYQNSFGSSGNQVGMFNTPQGIAIDSKGNIAVSDTWNNRIQIFTPDGDFIESFGELGFNPGQLANPDNIAFDSQDNLYVAENLNNRIQMFSKPAPESNILNKKAIIVAGGGGYDGNTLWQATQMCTNYAYRVLTFQGYTKDAIHYLSSDNTLDLDGNGLYDDVDNNATKDNLYSAITDWAKDADELLVYITDHGGDSFFRMNQTELLKAEDLDLWFDSIQLKNTKQITLIYDACQSGSFLDKITPPQGKQRIVIASASKGEQAYFTSQGSLSFSYLFWGFLMNGMNLFDAFISTKNSIEYTYQNQTPTFDDNGNGTGNEDMDGELAKTITLGRGIISAGDMPDIGAVSSSQILYGETESQIFAENIIDTDGIGRVWAVITPPDFSPNDPDEPVLTLPSIELVQNDNNRFQAVYSDFSRIGEYNIAVFAMDTCGSISNPRNISIIQNGDASIDVPPKPPIVTTGVNNTSVTISWSASDTATGYELFYAPYPDAEYIGSFDMGNVLQISFDLTKPVGFYVAIKAYNPIGSSDFSNIGVFIIP